MTKTPLIICVVGESGSGKTFMVDYLKSKYGINMVESYTDRPKRTPDETGHTFLTKEEFDDLNMADMIAFTCWPRYVEGGSVDVTRYCCMVDDIREDAMSYVIDERGLKYLRKYWSSKFNIFAVRIKADKAERLKRVGVNRYNRDEGLFNMSDDQFDCIITNDFTDEMYEKYDQIYEVINELQHA